MSPTAKKGAGPSGLARLVNSKVGRLCWFKHDEDGRIIEGLYQRGRKVLQMTGVTRVEHAAGGGSTYNVEETIWTVPRHVKISFGQPPAKGAK
jgi:hypothetical protein